MKILMVSEDVPHRSMGGLGRHAVTLARSLAQIGHEVDFMGNNLVAYQDVQNDMELPGRFFPDLNMRNIGWKEVWMGIYNPLRRPFIAWRLARAIVRRARDYDVVHYHGHFPLLANHISKDINFVQTRHDQGSDCLSHTRFRDHDVCLRTDPFDCADCATPLPSKLQRWVSGCAVWIYRKLVARAFRRHKTIFVSDMLRRNFCRTAGQGRWGVVIHNFVDYAGLKHFAVAGKTGSSLVEVFIAGKLYEPKGIEAFLEEVHNKVPEYTRITIAGDGENEGHLRQRYGSNRVVFLGWQSYPDTIRRLSDADAMVVPSILEESCATTVIEALALGKMVFALARGGTPELLRLERFPGQLLLYDGMGDLVAGLIDMKSTDSPRPNLNTAFGADVAVIRDEILNFYRAGRRSLQCH